MSSQSIFSPSQVSYKYTTNQPYNSVVKSVLSLKEPEVLFLSLHSFIRNILCVNNEIRGSRIKLFLFVCLFVCLPLDNHRMKVSWKKLWLLLLYYIQQFSQAKHCVFLKKHAAWNNLLGVLSNCIFPLTRLVMNIILATHRTMFSNLYSQKKEYVLCLSLHSSGTLCVNVIKFVGRFHCIHFNKFLHLALEFYVGNNCMELFVRRTSQSIISPNQQFCYFQHVPVPNSAQTSVSKEGSIVSFFSSYVVQSGFWNQGLIKKQYHLPLKASQVQTDRH